MNGIDVALARGTLRASSPRQNGHPVDFLLPRVDRLELLVELELLLNKCILLVIPDLGHEMLCLSYSGRWLLKIALTHALMVLRLGSPLVPGSKHLPSHIVLAVEIIRRESVRLQQLLPASSLHLRLARWQRSATQMLYVSLNILHASIACAWLVVLRLLLHVLLPHVAIAVARLLLLNHLRGGIQSLLGEVIV